MTLTTSSRWAFRIWTASTRASGRAANNSPHEFVADLPAIRVLVRHQGEQASRPLMLLDRPLRGEVSRGGESPRDRIATSPGRAGSRPADGPSWIGTARSRRTPRATRRPRDGRARGRTCGPTPAPRAGRAGCGRGRRAGRTAPRRARPPRDRHGCDPGAVELARLARIPGTHREQQPRERRSPSSPASAARRTGTAADRPTEDDVPLKMPQALLVLEDRHRGVGLVVQEVDLGVRRELAD